MVTNQQRLNLLKKEILVLKDKIQKKNLEEKYVEMINKIANGDRNFCPIQTEEWVDLMMPKERENDDNLLRYYHSLRLEYKLMLAEVKKIKADKTETKGFHVRLKKWLNSEWLVAGLNGAAIIQLSIEIVKTAAILGIFYSDEEDDQDQLI